MTFIQAMQAVKVGGLGKKTIIYDLSISEEALPHRFVRVKYYRGTYRLNVYACIKRSFPAEHYHRHTKDPKRAKKIMKKSLELAVTKRLTG